MHCSGEGRGVLLRDTEPEFGERNKYLEELLMMRIKNDAGYKQYITVPFFRRSCFTGLWFLLICYSTSYRIERLILDCAQPRCFFCRQIEVEASAYECVIQVLGHHVMRVSLLTPPLLGGANLLFGGASLLFRGLTLRFDGVNLLVGGLNRVSMGLTCLSLVLTASRWCSLDFQWRKPLFRGLKLVLCGVICFSVAFTASG